MIITKGIQILNLKIRPLHEFQCISLLEEKQWKMLGQYVSIHQQNHVLHVYLYFLLLALTAFKSVSQEI